jgi:hypothetical protein
VVNPDDKEALHYMRQEMNRGFQRRAGCQAMRRTPWNRIAASVRNR